MFIFILIKSTQLTRAELNVPIVPLDRSTNDEISDSALTEISTKDSSIVIGDCSVVRFIRNNSFNDTKLGLSIELVRIRCEDESPKAFEPLDENIR